MDTIAFLNQKGGVGKTSTCYHLSGVYSLAGRRALLLDLDPQSSLTQGFFGPAASRALAPGQTVASLFSGDRPFPEEVIRPTGVPGVDILPGSRHATDFNVPRPWAAAADQQACIRDFLAEIDGRYEVVVIDCPPNLHLCSWAALVAAGSVVVPLQPEDFGRRAWWTCRSRWPGSGRRRTPACMCSGSCPRWSTPGSRSISSTSPR